MEPRQLQYISAVAAHRSFTKAAKALYITQPSLSHYINKVEAELGEKLFDRSTTPLSLTYAGEQYMKYVRQYMRLNDEMAREFRDIKENRKGRLRIGMPRDRAAFMLPIVLPGFHEQYPQMEIDLYETSSNYLLEAVLAGKTDFAILPHHVADQQFDAVTICEEELLLTVPPGWIDQRRLASGKRKAVELEMLRDFPFVLLRRGHAIREAMELLFQSLKIQPNVMMETSSNITAYRMASCGMACAIVPRMTISLARAQGNVDVYTLAPSPLTWEVKAVYRKDAYIGSAEQAFFDIARTSMEQYAPVG